MRMRAWPRPVPALFKMTTELRHSNIKHGHSRRTVPRSRTYVAWSNMKTRCLNPNRDAWKDYGGRGIKICERWFQFENFLNDMGRCPAGLTLERKNPNGDYEPGNCVWATVEEQSNNKRNTRWLTYAGKRQRLSEWAKELNVNWMALRARIRRWGVETAISTLINTERPCALCGTPFSSQSIKKRYCGPRCRQLAQYDERTPLQSRECVQCGAVFRQSTPKQIHCGPKCRSDYSNALQAKRRRMGLT